MGLESVIVGHPEIAYGLLALLQIALGAVVTLAVGTFKREINALREADVLLEQRVLRELEGRRILCDMHQRRMDHLEQERERNRVDIERLSGHYGEIMRRLERLENKLDRALGNGSV